MASRPTRLRRQYQQHEQQPRAKWTASLTKILAELMVDQVRQGNRQNNSFGKKAWKYMCDEFFKKTGLKWDKEQLKNRYAVLRRQYVIVKSLLDQSDFSWDDNTGIITATDEAWDNYTKVCSYHLWPFCKPKIYTSQGWRNLLLPQGLNEAFLATWVTT